jgi:galactose-6-phosphate isomerase
MALIDVSELMCDPDFADLNIPYERNTQTVGANGLATLATKRGFFTGVVLSDGGDKLERTPDGERIKGSITIRTKFPLIDGDDGKTADIITWKGKRYTVSTVSDYSNWGRGFVTAQCALLPLSG